MTFSETNIPFNSLHDNCYVHVFRQRFLLKFSYARWLFGNYNYSYCTYDGKIFHYYLGGD